jgi:hypothetical protein
MLVLVFGGNYFVMFVGWKRKNIKTRPYANSLTKRMAAHKFY